MSAMLGEMLLKVGALTEAQLQQVLNAQAIYGGRLGTNLVELGLLGEEELARALHEKLGVPCVELASLKSLPREILTVVPFEMVERYRVLPIALKGRKLTLAMEDPSDFKAIDDIGFVTGLVVVPRVCSELRLTLALEHYYGIQRRVRYIHVEGGFSSRFAGASAKDWDGETPATATGPVLPTRKEAPGPLGQLTLGSLAEAFSTAVDEREVVAALLCYLGGEFDRGAFLSVQRGVVMGVKGVVGGEGGEGADHCSDFSCLLAEGALFRRVVDDRRLFLGEVASGPERRLLDALGGGTLAAALLLPLSVDGRVAAIVCVHDEHGRLAGGAFELQRVAAMAELTFEMIRLRKRIRAC